MAKLLLILFVGLILESTGIVFLKKGVTEVGNLQRTSLAGITGVARAALVNSQILLGVFFEALFFICLIILMSKNEVSFLWPMTALSFVFGTLAAIWFLHEHVSSIRWMGVLFILIGVALISYSQHLKEKSPLSAEATLPENQVGSQ